MVNELELSGIIGSTPIGFMAALGIIRICTMDDRAGTARISWKQNDDWVAVLNTDAGLSEDDLISSIFSFMQAEKQSFFHMDDVRMEPDKFKGYALELINSATYSVRSKADYWTAFGTELIVDKSKGLIKPSSFYMSTGKQKFLGKVKKSMERITKARIHEALFEPWKYDDSHELAMGWDPSTHRIHALRKKDPSSDDSNLCESAAEWLAYESLPMFPTVVGKDGRVATSGFSDTYFTWPIWNVPVELDTVRTLILSREIFDESVRNRIAARGVAAIYRSRRFEFSKGYGVFLPGELIWLSTS
ncbi:MAG: hypothetical protein M1592_02365 [Candidatus Thermoplasmatota archaeon]|jgi:hypothetical protein|nr:hypothetical protein [Candidatus Thermoplasmatota archaeon]